MTQASDNFLDIQSSLSKMMDSLCRDLALDQVILASLDKSKRFDIMYEIGSVAQTLSEWLQKQDVSHLKEYERGILYDEVHNYGDMRKKALRLVHTYNSKTKGYFFKKMKVSRVIKSIEKKNPQTLTLSERYVDCERILAYYFMGLYDVSTTTKGIVLTSLHDESDI